MDYKDYYKIIGLKKGASQDEVKRAYRKLARKYHPDVSKEDNAERRFKELGEAYEVLKDPEKRKAYDQLGTNWKAGQDFNPPPNWGTGFEFDDKRKSDADSSKFSDFFESLFGRGFGTTQENRQRGSKVSQGEDHRAKVFIDIEDAYKGAKRSITLQSPERDRHGHSTTKQRTLNVKIPKGVKQGQRIRLSGLGSAKKGKSPAGDLYLEVEFNKHPFYKITGTDVFLELPIAPWEAALGATIKVPTPDGQVDLKIAKGTTTGKKLRLKGRGIPSSPPGDFYVLPQVVLPPADSNKAKELYKKMEKEINFNPRSKFDTIKS